MNKKVCLSLLMASCFSLGMYADKTRTFYNEKNDIIGISGQAYKLFGNAGYSNHFFGNDILFEDVKINEIKKQKNENKTYDYVDVQSMLAQLNGQKAGVQILKAILDDGNGKVSFDRLQERSVINTSRKEEETASQDEFMSKEDILKDNVGPQFAKNYIFFEQASSFKTSKNVWALFHAEMSMETFDQVWNLLAEHNGDLSLSELDNVDVPVTYVASGLSKKDEEDFGGYTMRDLGRTCGDFAIRGNIVRKGFEEQDSKKLYADVGTSQGVEHLDRMFIYRPAVDKNGNMYSKHIATARAVKETPDKVRLYTYAGGFANSKKGDVAVLQHDKRMSTSFAIGYQNKSVDFNFQFEYLLGMTPSGMGHELFVRLGASYILPSEDTLKEGANYQDGYLTEAYVPVDMEKLMSIRGVNGITIAKDNNGDYYTRYFDSFKKPIPIRLGVGYGPTWNFAHMLELMPYVGAEFEMLLGLNQGVFDEEGDEHKTTYMAGSVRVPLGARLALNLNRKGNAQFFLGAEYYVLNYGLNLYQGASDNGTDSSKGSFAILPYDWWQEGVATHNGVGRNGFHAYAGLRFNF